MKLRKATAKGATRLVTKFAFVPQSLDDGSVVWLERWSRHEVLMLRGPNAIPAFMPTAHLPYAGRRWTAYLHFRSATAKPVSGTSTVPGFTNPFCTADGWWFFDFKDEKHGPYKTRLDAEAGRVKYNSQTQGTYIPTARMT